MPRKTLNHRNIAWNLSEAIAELARITQRATSQTLKEEQLQIQLLHAYHHLNFAWNTRFLPTSAHGKMTERQFKQLGSYPSRIEKL
jgi:hypothetical protein